MEKNMNDIDNDDVELSNDDEETLKSHPSGYNSQIREFAAIPTVQGLGRTIQKKPRS